MFQLEMNLRLGNLSTVYGLCCLLYPAAGN